MQKRFFIHVFLLYFMGVSLPALSKDRPVMKHCEPVHLRSSEGLWVSIFDDGSGSYGFGPGLARIKVVKNTFNYEKVYSVFVKAFATAMKNTDDPYMAVSCFTASAKFAGGHPLAQDQQLLSELLLLARKNAQPPMNEFEARSHYHVESFLRDSPWKPERHASLTNANSTDVKLRD
jgi:hypothetical protein